MAFPVRWFMWVPAAFNAFWCVLAANSFWEGAESGDLTRCFAMIGLFGMAFASLAACYLVAMAKGEPR